MKRLRFMVDVTAEDPERDSYKWLAWVLEKAIRDSTYDLARDRFFLPNAKVLRRQPEKAN